MLTAKEAFKMAMDARRSEEKKKDKINQVAKWISEAASEGRLVVFVKPEYLPPDSIKYFEGLGFEITGDYRDEHLSVSWRNGRPVLFSDF